MKMMYWFMMDYLGIFINVHFAGQYAIDHANEIKTPLLVMHGIEDRLTSPKEVKNLPQTQERMFI